MSPARPPGRGFRVRERMSGWHGLADGPPVRRPLRFEGEWGPDRLRDWLDPRSPAFLWQEIRGTLTAVGLCEEAPFRGTLSLDYFGLRRIRYVLDFDVAGRPHRPVGDKDGLRWWNLLVTHTTCAVTVTELPTGRLVTRGTVRFRLRDLPGLLRIRRAP